MNHKGSRERRREQANENTTSGNLLPLVPYRCPDRPGDLKEHVRCVLARFGSPFVGLRFLGDL